MDFERSSGVLLHVSSLPSLGGIGDLRQAAHEFVTFLAAAKQHIWQVLPLNPTGYGNSPYSGSSAFAGNPLLISLEVLRDWGWISAHGQAPVQGDPGTTEDRIAGLPGREGNVNFEAVEERKLPLLIGAACNFLDHGPHDVALRGQWDEFEAFCREQACWLDDFALYAELRRQYHTGAWTEWPEPLRKREPGALEEEKRKHARALNQAKALQFAFSRQWEILRNLAARNAIRILGDVAIFVNMDSADVWVHPELFEWTKSEAIARGRRSAGLFFADRAAVGESALPLGRA